MNDKAFNTNKALQLALMYGNEVEVPITVIINGVSFNATMEKIEVVKYVGKEKDGFFIRGAFH